MNKTEAVKTLQTYLESRGRSAHTVRAYVSDLEQYFDWVATRYPITDTTWTENALRPAIAQRYLFEIRPAMSPSTVNRRISTIRCIAKATGKPDPLVGYNGPKRTRPPAHPLPHSSGRSGG